LQPIGLVVEKSFEWMLMVMEIIPTGQEVTRMLMKFLGQIQIIKLRLLKTIFLLFH
jgi:hypothetical protein